MGQSRESYVSKLISRRGARVLLLSSLSLRTYGCGQIDLAYIFEKTIYLLEIKGSARVSFSQAKRLSLSGQLLSNLLKYPCQVKIVCTKQSLKAISLFDNLSL